MGEACPQTRPCYCAALRPNGRAAWRPSIPPANPFPIVAKAKGAVPGCPDPAELAKALKATLPNFPFSLISMKAKPNLNWRWGKRLRRRRERKAKPCQVPPSPLGRQEVLAGLGTSGFRCRMREGLAGGHSAKSAWGERVSQSRNVERTDDMMRERIRTTSDYYSVRAHAYTEYGVCASISSCGRKAVLNFSQEGRVYGVLGRVLNA